jgi:peptidoglycan/xylan/chitin deacetylase (PgdA/CDA1 family)
MVLRLAFLALLLLARFGRAEIWPQPAMGESKSGDVELLLTFDDGPAPGTTPAVLDILKAHHIQAVFFLNSYRMEEGNKKVPPILKRILADGHIIANHTANHADLCKKKLTDERAAYEIDHGKEVIEKEAGIPIAWFRAPYGARCPRVEQMLAERHIFHFHWDLDPQEWKRPNADRVVKYVIGELEHAHSRDVLLLHDIHEVTIKALPQIIQWIDDENAKRARSHKHKIVFLRPSELAIERLPPGLADWFVDATSDLRALPKLVANALPR